MNNHSNHLITEILAEIAVYKEPQLLLEKYSNLLDTTKTNKSDLVKYSGLLSDIQYAWNKTKKYRKYFMDFYPSSDQVDKIDALNHHIHAYLEDMTILKNKIEVFLGELKNDVGKKAINKTEVKAFFKEGIKKTKEVFNGISKHRDPHHHKGMRFFDGDLLKAENAHNMILTLQSQVFASVLNPKRVPDFIKKLEKDKEEFFEKAKEHWIEMAKRNDEQTSGYLEALLRGIHEILYNFLKIKSTKDIFNIS